jgi:dihydrofolate synthase/folylpolyglutamate synthase
MLRNKNENSLAIALERCARFGVKPGLEAVRAVCAAMDNPQDSLRVVHVAGTNGKGAVCALIDSALRAAGFRTGRYTSPHLVSLNERFFLDGAPVSTEKLNAACSTLNPQLSTNLTYFELLTATAFELYRREKVDYLVLETGLGGRLDATNIVKKPAVSIITRIGLDHCDWLGHTIAEIAAEKGGIIKPEVPVVLGAMPDDARHVLERIAVERHAPCLYAPENSKLETGNPKLKTLNLQGTFNRENAVTAFAALKVLGIADSAIARGFASVVWPGRYQRLTVGDRRILVDGAHNPPAMRALVDSLKAEPQESEGGFPVRSVLCGFCGDKDVGANLKILREVAEAGFAVPIRNPRTLPPERTAALMREADFRSVTVCKTLEDALNRAPDGTVVCGSLFLAGEVLELLGALPGPDGLCVPNETFTPRAKT